MKKLIVLFFITIVCWGCSDVDDQRVPLTSVRIEVTLAQQQNRSYWANVPATFVTFLKPNVPYGFPYTISSTTGYGGVLQVCGFDNQLFAFDLSCPYEHNPNIRIEISETDLNAFCRECSSTYDVFYGSGAPINGPSAINGYSLRKYNITYISSTGSYMIIN
ncbi:MAG: hypothetical protein IKW05_01850 [Muribaculaceae bacterium]|nr:hypothetical protein [Muribaculaceae bacterium]